MGNASVDSCDEYGNTPLHYAALHGHLNVIKILIELGCYTNKTGQMGWTALHFACKGGHSNVIKKLITENICHPMSVDDSGNSPIHIATKFGHSNLIRMLVTEFDYDINAAGKNKWTPLHYACEGGDINIVKMLIFELNCHPMKCNEHGNTPLHIAALKCNLDIVRLLLNSGYCANVRNKHGSTLLHAASAGGHSETVSVLISYYGCDPMSKDEYDHTPLHCAAGNGHQGVIRLLVGVFHCDVNVRSRNGSTPLHTACARGQVATVRLLISEFGCNPLEKTNIGDTPLHVAAQNGKEDVIQLLVKLFGCSASTGRQDGRTPLHAACQGGHISTICMLLLEFECDIAAEDDHGDSPLDIIAAPEDLWHVIKPLASKIGGRMLFHAACQRGRLETARFLVSECGYNPNFETDSGSTFLHTACLKGHCDVIRFLITECGCNPSVRGYNGMTALHSACKGGHVKAISALLFEYRCSPVDRDDHAHTPLHIACMEGHCDVIKLFSDVATMAWDENSNGDTPLEIAIDSGDIKIVKEFIGHVGLLDDNHLCRLLQRAYTSGQLDIFREFVSEFNCDPNTVGDDGESVLFTACEKKDFDMVHLLITECGCIPNVNYDDWECSTPLHLACKNKDLNMVHKLISDFDVDTMAWDENTNTPLEIAIDTGDLRIVREFVGHVGLLDNNDQSWLLQRAYRYGQLDIFRVLISEFNCDPSAVDDDGESVLFTACEKKDFDMVHLLITEFGCNPNMNYDGKCCSTPLHLACRNKDVDMVHKLISDFGVNALVWDENGDSPLEIAIETGDMRIVKEFIGHTDMDDYDMQYWHLRQAYTSGHWDMFRALISDFGCDPNTVSDDGYSILRDACEKKDWDMVHLLITKFGCDPKVNWEESNTPLHLACKNTDLNMVHKLISDFDVHTLATDENGKSSLEIAIDIGDMRIIREFVGHVGLLNNNDQCSLLQRAYRHGQWDIFRALVSEFNCDPSAVDDDGESVFLTACEKKDFEMVRLLITEFGCNPNVNYDGKWCSTPLHLACKNKHVDMVHTLISDFGVNTLVWDENGDSPLEIAIETGDMRIIKEFIGHILRLLISDCGCDPNTETDDYDSILRDACKKNDWDMVRLLITEFGCDPKVDIELYEEISTPLHLACENKDLDMVHKLISDFDVHTLTYNENGDTPLEIAIETGDMRIVKEFIGHTDMDDYDQYCRHLRCACMSGHWDILRVLISDFGCDPNTETNGGDSILRDACKKNDWDMVCLLITEFGCDPNVDIELYAEISTPLHLACRNEDLDMVHKLISDFNVCTWTHDEEFQTPLEIAIETGDMRIVEEFIGYTDMDNDDQYSHLYRACMSGHWGIFRVLISDFGCDPNTVYDGDSILRDACKNNDWDMVRLLITEFGCDPNVDYDGWRCITPLHLACENKDLEMVHRLISDFNVDSGVKFKDESEAFITPLELASRDGSMNIVKEFADYINTEDHPLACCYACEEGHLDVVRVLISELGFNPMGRNGLHPLNYACRRETNLNIVHMLISEYGVSINAKDKDGDTAMDVAIASGCINNVKELAKNANISRSQLQEGLRRASSNGHLEMVECLIVEFDVDPSSKNSDGDMPIHTAARHGHTKIVSMLINKYNISPVAEGHNMRTPLHEACASGSYDVFKLLVTIKNLDIQHRDTNSNTHLHTAAENGQLQMVKELKQLCAALAHTLNENLQTPLHLALMNGHKTIAKLLLSQFNSQIVDVAGNSTLHLAAMCGYTEMVSKLIQQYKCSPDCLNNKHQTPLHVALEKKYEQTADVLLSKFHCCPTSVDIDGNTPLHLAAAKDLPVVIRMLIDQYSSIPDCRNNKQETPLLLAAEAKNWTIVDSLVSEFDCCPMKANVDGNTPLHYATMFGPTEIIQKMINKCASTPDCSNSKQETVLLLAAKAKKWTIVDTLLSKFDCYSMKADIDGNTPLHYTAMYGPTEINRKMIKQCNSSLDCVNGKQETPLLLAAKKKEWAIVDILLSEGCSPTAVDAEGNTVLHVAVKNGNLDVVASLLSEYKVYSQPRNTSDHTPLYYASTNRYFHIVAELVKHNCNPATVDEDYKMLEQISHRKLLEGSLTKVFVIGNKSAGKSTLIEALKNETQQDPYFNDKVASHTAGIVPSVHQSEQYGRVLFYDFAGDPEYYSSHAAALERLLTSSHHIFLLVVDFSEEEEAILQTLGYWLTFISYNSKDTQPKSQVIVVGSHADIIEAKGEDAKWKVCELFTEISSELCSHHPYTEMVGYCSLDCRTCECARIEKLYELLKQCCLSPVSDESKQLSVGAIILLGVLQRDFKGVIACEVAQICMHIQLAELYLPQGLVSVYSYLQELNSQGVVLIVGNHEGLREEWVILDVSEFLATVHRNLFASTSLSQVCSSRLLSNVGIIPESDLRNVLAQFEIALLQQCLKYLQYCFEVDDSEVLQSIFTESVYTHTGTNVATDSCNTAMNNCEAVKTCAAESALLHDSSDTTNCNSKLLFFPALLRGQRSEIRWYEESPACCKGWYIECAGEYDYFPPRFLHVLLLRLAFTFTLPAHNTKKKRKNLDLFSRRCNMWKNGIYWLMQTDVECMVEVVKQNKALVVIVRSKKEFEADCACMFSNIVIKVLEARQDFCHSLAANAYLIHPDDLNQTFLPRVEDLHLFDMGEVKRALSNNENSVVSVGEQNFKRLSLSRLQTHSIWSKCKYKCLN